MPTFIFSCTSTLIASYLSRSICCYREMPRIVMRSLNKAQASLWLKSSSPLTLHFPLYVTLSLEKCLIRLVRQHHIFCVNLFQLFTEAVWSTHRGKCQNPRLHVFVFFSFYDRIIWSVGNIPFVFWVIYTHFFPICSLTYFGKYWDLYYNLKKNKKQRVEPWTEFPL